MSRGLQWQVTNIPLAAGIDAGDDTRATQPPGLAVCKDVQFDELGGLQTRYPYAAAISSISGGGTLSNCRRVYDLDGELVCFTKDTLYSWNVALSKWVSRGTHMAVSVDEVPVFSTTDDQIDCDRAELSSTVVYAWATTAATPSVYVAAIDKTTGAVLVSPTALSGTNERPRLVALSTKILLFTHNGTASVTGALHVRALDPAAPATGIASAATQVVASGTFNLFYDAMKIPSADTAILGSRRVTTTSHDIIKVTSALGVTTSTKARTADGPIAVSCEPTGTSVQVVRANGSNIQGDFITISSLADVTTGQAVGTVVGTPVNQVTACHRSVQNGGAFRCYAFWHGQESAASSATTKYNFVDTAGTIGTQATLNKQLAVASRAFDYNGDVYVNTVFAAESTAAGSSGAATVRAQLQNTYVLMRDDGHLASKSAWQRAGGLAYSFGRLPGVELTSGLTGYTWAASFRRVIVLGGNSHTGYADREPLEITYTFDSNKARRALKLGGTTYITGGIVMQYDGVALTELGFLVYPWRFSGVVLGVGQVDVGIHTYKSTYRWQNAAGEQERSTTATAEQVTVGASQFVQLSTLPLTVTRKTTPLPEVAIEIWRTIANPTIDTDFYLDSSRDPVATGNNGYIANNPTGSISTYSDNFTDANLITKEANPENGSILENLAPPSGTIIAASDRRLFLANIAGFPNAVWYSRLREDGEVVGFNDALVFSVPQSGGDITAIRFLNETTVVFRETATYAFSGGGFANDGTGENFGPATSQNLDVARNLSLDVGAVSDEAVATFPDGILFKTSKGWYVLDRGWNVRYVGQKVSSFDSDTVLAIHTVETQHHIRILTSARMLVFDYLVGEWSEWTVSDGVHATMWNGSHVYLTSTGPRIQNATYSGVDYGIDIETQWFKPADQQGRVNVRWFSFLGENRSDGNVMARIRVARDYKTNASGVTWFDDRVWTGLQDLENQSPLQVRHSPSQHECEAMKVRLTVIGASSAAASLSTSSGASWSSGSTIATSGSVWASTLVSRNVGTPGNSLTVTIYTSDGFAGVEVRDGQTYSAVSGTWSDSSDNVGIRVGGAITVGQLETAINDQSRWLRATADPTPTKVITDTNTNHISVALSGGTTVAPSDEGIKLTGISLEYGVRPGIFRRLPAASTQ